MDKMIIRCYFMNSKDFIKEITKNFSIQYSKKFNYRQDIGLFLYDDWLLIGEENTMQSFRKSIENEDYDIEILDWEKDYL